MSRISIVVYTPANLNAIDGSSVWVQSVTLALAGVPNADVSLLLSHPITNDRLVAPLLAHPDVLVVDPWREKRRFPLGRRRSTPPTPLSLDDAARILTEMITTGPQSLVVRGATAARRLAAEPALRGRLLPYLTDIPQRADDLSDDSVTLIKDVMGGSRILLCQTEEMQTFLEKHLPPVVGRTWLLPPIVPNEITPMPKDAPTTDNLQVAYSGKFARLWNTLDMCNLPALLSDRGVTTTLTMVGDKINKDPDHPEFVAEMRRRLERSHGVAWVGGVSRERSLELVGRAHIGMSWRSPELDDSLELSTKLLEYSAVGTPPVLNRTQMHERIFGPDYPLFVSSQEDVIDRLERVAREEDFYSSALASIAGVADAFSLSRATESLSALFQRLHPTASNDTLV